MLSPMMVLFLAMSQTQPGAAPQDKIKLMPADPLAALRANAEAGDVDAQVNLGSMLFLGKECPKDEKESIKWFKRAAAAGNDQAIYCMGLFYAAGMMVDRNLPVGYAMLLQAVSMGNENAGDALLKVRAHMSAEQIEEGNKIAATLITH